MKVVSVGSNALPSGRKISWNQTVGSSPLGMGVSQAYLVFVFPVTSPQLIAATLFCLSIGITLKKVLHLSRAMYSVQMSGRPYWRRVSMAF